MNPQDPSPTQSFVTELLTPEGHPLKSSRLQALRAKYLRTVDELEEDEITADDIEREYNVKPRRANEIIRRMATDGVAKRIGKTRTGKIVYRLVV